jgi:aldose sugar dehydrogenase
MAASCSQNQPGSTWDPSKVIESQKQIFRLDTLSAALSNPWGIAFLPDGRILVTEKAGDIRVFESEQLKSEKISGVPPVAASGQGGLLDIQLAPDYAQSGWIYLSYSKPGPGGSATTMARAKLQGNALVSLEELFVAEPYLNSGVHFGSRIAFDGKGYVFLSTGERGTMSNAQDLGNHYGKVIRLHENGQVPTDNPFVQVEGAKPEIWSYGHRNIQGMIYDSVNERLWSHEHGPRGGDEINLVEKGLNYGWPVITFGINYNGTIITEITEKEGMEQPTHYWTPSIAPCGLAMVHGDKYPGWKGNLMVGALAGRHVARVELSGTAYVAEERLLEGLARVRAVAQSPEGYLYVATEGPGMLLKLIPIAP